ncbi:hypothetical protein GGI12_004589 [Dipsacomyces acuminosporus]|nr:hypothetical protein GGI12_004589 [Dipsacomyces acuminosporus]
MERDSIDALRSPMRPWAQMLQSQQQQHQSPSLALASPMTPQTAFSTRSLMTPVINRSSMYKTPTTPLPAASSLMALDAKNVTRDFGQPRLDLTAEDKWRRLGARVLPLFNGDRLQGTVEENNEIVSDLDSVWHEIHNILRVGMSSLIRNLYRQYGLVPKFETMPNHGIGFSSSSSSNNNNNNNCGSGGNGVGSSGKQLHLAMLSMSGIVNAENIGSDRLIGGLVHVWEMVNSHVLPYIEGVFLPLQQFKVATTVSSMGRPTNVRQAVLMQFKDSIVVPLLGRLDEAAGMARAQGAQGALGNQNTAALLQMLTALALLTPTERGPIFNAARTLSMAYAA